MAADILSENLSLLLSRSLKALSANRADPCEVRGLIVSHRSLFSSIFNVGHLQEQKRFWSFSRRPAEPPGPGARLHEQRRCQREPINRLARLPGHSGHLSWAARPERITWANLPSWLISDIRRLSWGESKQAGAKRQKEPLIVGQWPVWASGTSGHKPDVQLHQPVRLNVLAALARP